MKKLVLLMCQNCLRNSSILGDPWHPETWQTQAPVLHLRIKNVNPFIELGTPLFTK